MKKQSLLNKTLFAIITLLLLAVMFNGSNPILNNHIAQASTYPSEYAIASAPAEQAKYLFLFIGDGMAIAQRNAAELYLAATKNGKDRPEDVKLLMNQFPAQGMTTTYDLSSIITDSASAGTALASGNKTISGTINMDPSFKQKYTTIAEIAKSKDWKIGIISSVSLDHATPAAFYAHQASRKDYYDIAVEMGKSNFDYFAGGGLLQPTGKDKDKPDALELAKGNGYAIVNTRADFDKLTSKSGKVIAISPILEDEASMNYDMDKVKDDISLADFTKKGIELLDNPKGFFMMVEGGKIDWSCHANDAAASINDTLALDVAIQEAYKFYQKHPKETLIIVTGDHETGGLTIGFAGTGYNNYINKLQDQKLSYVGFNKILDQYKEKHSAQNAKFDDMKSIITDNFGMTFLSGDERTSLQAAVDKGSAQEASDSDKNAMKDAKSKLSQALSEAEEKVLRDAFSASMMAKDERTKIAGVDLLYGGYEPLTVKLTTILNQKAGLGWTSYAHTGVPVLTSAIGAGAEQFNGYYDNTDIYKKMMSITGLK